MSQFNLRLLGPFEAELNGTPVSFAYGKIKAILAYLAFTLGQPIHREKLAGLIWPDHPQAIALENLRQAISRLRKSINDTEAFPPYLIVDRERIALNREADIQVDVDLFEEAIASCARHVHRHAQTCRVCCSHMEAACQLYRGEFLDDLCLPDSNLFEDWAAGHRVRLHEQALEALGWQAQYQCVVGDYPAALEYSRRLVDLEPLGDEIILQGMQLLVQAGKVDQALAQFSRFRKKLETEIGVAPSRRILKYSEQLRSGEAGPDLPRERIAKNLPAQLSPLIGRQVELIELEAWLADPSRRLITLLGPGGIGKTRLAMATADQHAQIFADGVIFTSFTEADHTSHVVQKISSAAGLQAADGPDCEQKLLNYLAGKDLLLVLDGLEYASDAEKVVQWLLEKSPGLVILVASRERLNLAGEWVFPVGGLPFPPSERSTDIAKYSAVELFVLIARQRDPTFTLNEENCGPMSRICRLVEGMPLAIGLASAWAHTLPCAEIARELQNGLDLLTSAGPSTEGHPISMRAAFGQSWNRLPEAERRVFRRTTVFRGGFDRQAAEAVAGASLDELASLVDKSFLSSSTEGRYDMHDLLLKYGAEKLVEANEVDQMRQRQFDYFLGLAEKNEAEFHFGDNSFQAFFWPVKERANLWAAYEWALGGDPPRNRAGARRLLMCIHEELHQTGMQNKDFTRPHGMSRF
jgi:predicted ATPase/DNA-binding SARP family transcriptional activator